MEVDVLVERVRQFQRLIAKQRWARNTVKLLVGINGLLVIMTALRVITFPMVAYLGDILVGWWLLIRQGQLTRQISEFKAVTGELTDLKQQSVVWYLNQARKSLVRGHRQVCLFDYILMLNSTLCGLAFTWHFQGIGEVAALLLIPMLFAWLHQFGTEKVSDQLMAECRQHLGLVDQIVLDVLAEHPDLVGPASISRIEPDTAITAERGLSPTESVSVSNG